ncbi:MAG TPA: methyl-accepting chemotaxis protein [Steroidobacteraceae bacterium]|nr:methyl-accepting chemotaxis protein [Steroidobacteraceae bacterium]
MNTAHAERVNAESEERIPAATQPSEVPQGPDPLVRISTLLEALPIWARQIETSRGHTEDAVVSLSERFSGIAQRLDAALGREEGIDRQDVSAQMRDSERDLKLVMDALRAIQQSRDALANEIRGLAAYTEDVRSMASEVESIAFQTNVLALNAAIEAAHAGERGKGFAVVAHEVRALSNAARDTGKRITQKITLISEALGKISETNEIVAERDQREVKSSEANIGAVLDRFTQSTSQFAETAQRSMEQSRAIKGEVEESLVQLQFQDRVSQILAQVVSSIGQMTDWAGSDIAPPQADERQQLTQMLGSYATEEQRRNHQGLAVDAVAPQAVTFF